jgi:glycosyltransferase involved in cell wall biosynthesis
MANGITGILCCYNAELFIEKTLDSIFEQAVSIDSLIIVDDFSQDSTIEKIRDYLSASKLADGWVTIYENPCNLGISMSYNFGIKACKTRYALMLSHDDINHPDRVAATLTAFSQGAPIVCSYMNVPATGGNLQVSDSSPVVALGMALGNKIPAPTVAFDVDLVKKHNLYFNPQCDWAEDYDLWCKFILKGFSFHVVPQNLVAYTVHDRQVSVVRQEEQKLIAEKTRVSYIQALFPFLLIDQSEILIKILLHEPHLISSLERGFVEHVIREMDKNRSNAGIGILYDYIKILFDNAGAVPATTGQA